MESRTGVTDKQPKFQQSSSDPVSHLSLSSSEDPLQWPKWKKWPRTMIVISMSLTLAYYSGVYAAAIPFVMADYHCSNLVATSGISWFLLGFACGPLVFAPLSEMFGRNPIILVTLLLFILSNIGSALAPNVVCHLIFRYIAGFCGAPTVTNAGGSLTDMWPATERSVPWAIFSAASFLTVIIGPIIGDAIVQYLPWQWTYWTSMALGGTVYLAALLFLPETYRPKLLSQKAARQGLVLEQIDLRNRYREGLTRPWIMLFTEPIVWGLTLYMSFVYGVLTLSLVAYPIVYTDIWGWSTLKTSLGYSGIAGGMALATIFSPFLGAIHRSYVRKIGPVPEARFPLQIWFSWLLPIGLFWFAWTALPPKNPVVGIVAGVPIGIGSLSVFLDVYAYLTDCYGKYSASAMAANGVLLRLFGAGFPLFADSLYRVLGVGWGTSLLGFVALALAPLPWLFYRYGPILRKKSAYHSKLASELE
ncbi:hypothetical protein UA08_09464 [Talaromyces atroroseus]|uniref:Major facilitator superfamily (MFS) profile domain-containing protein n=1 Tax=Talaromyces atroroseus TaxID=1441469 RepID=A0A1Q5Q620_TALAT|nr:hypothetical protein UA08_09464 [Talaromyces atroroseus]OKL55265.1 hypothetical protein UA08_09464 [Talaromyces atroroseus]